MMKKRNVCLFVMAAVLGLSGCGSTAQEPVDTQGEVQEETTADEMKTEPEDEAENETDDEAVEEQTPEEEEYADFYVEDTDVTMEELRAANSPIALMKDHQSLGFTWENYDDKDTLQSTTKSQYIMFQGKLWFDSVMTDSEGNNTYYSDYEAEDTPGATYCYQEGGDEGARWLTLYPSDEYQYWVAQRWMSDLYPDQKEEITDISTQDGAIIVQVHTTYNNFNNYFDTLYYVDPDTKLILYREDSWYDEEGTLLSVDKYSPVYDEPHVSDQVARSAVSDGEDSCELTVVFEPGSENEETQSFRIAKGTFVSVVSNSNYTFYGDADCTDLIDQINTEAAERTIYVKLGD